MTVLRYALLIFFDLEELHRLGAMCAGKESL